MKHLSRPDEILLIAIACLGDNAYSTPILQEVAKRGDKTVSVGSLWVSLDQLATKGYLRKRTEKSENRHGGRPRVYYRLSPRGIRILMRVREFQKKLWKNVPDLGAYETD